MADNYTILLPCLTSQGDTQSCSMSSSSVHIPPAERQNQYKVCPSHTIKINFSDFSDIKYFVLIHRRMSGLYMQSPNNAFQVLLTFYRFYHTTTIYLLLSYNINNFNNLNNFVPHKVKTPWRWCRCIETCRSTSTYKILIHICCAFVGIDNKKNFTVIVRCLAVGNVSQFEISKTPCHVLRRSVVQIRSSMYPTGQGKFVPLCLTFLTVLN